MAVYVVTGALGSGKTLQAMARIRLALRAGRRVATNIDLRLEKLVPAGLDADVVRLPDWPTASDLDSLGDGSDGPFDEKTFGWIVLDEVAVFLNSRDWNGRERAAVIAWLRHARKKRWHLILLSQDLESLDKQVRVALSELVVSCRRGDRLAVPVLSTLVKLFGLGPVKFPQVHIGVVRYGPSIHAPLADRWLLTDARRLWGTYDTAQVVMGEGCAYSVLDHRSAPCLWAPAGLYNVVWRAFLWRLGFPPSAAQRAFDDARFAETVYRPCRSPTFRSFRVRYVVSGEAGHPESLGGA